MSLPNWDKVEQAYVWFALKVASEATSTPDHAKRLKIAKQMTTIPPTFDQFVKLSMINEGFQYETSQDDINNHLESIALNLVKLGLGD